MKNVKVIPKQKRLKIYKLILKLYSVPRGYSITINNGIIFNQSGLCYAIENIIKHIDYSTYTRLLNISYHYIYDNLVLLMPELKPYYVNNNDYWFISHEDRIAAIQSIVDNWK